MKSSQRGLFVTGTDTGVGKTWIAAALARRLSERDVPVRVRKPVESGATPGPTGLIPEDALTLNQAVGEPDPLDIVCPFPMTTAVSPQRAAVMDGLTLHVAQLQAACLYALEPGNFLLVEGAGGFYSPLCEDGVNGDLAERLALPVLLVVADRLGCINHSLLTLEAIERRGLEVQAIVLNQVQPNQAGSMDNAADLAHWCERTVISLPWCDGSSGKTCFSPATLDRVTQGLL